MPGDIEFLDGGGGGPDDRGEEQLDDGRRDRSRWGIAVGTVLVAGAIAAAITLHGGGPPRAAPTSSALTGPSPRYQVSIVPAPGSSAPTARATPASVASVADFLPAGSRIGSVAMVGDHVVVLAPGVLGRVARDRNGNLHPDGVSAVGLPIGDPNYADWTLLFVGHDLWAVGGVRAYRIDSSTLRARSLILSPASVVDAGALGSQLYLDTEVGVYEVARGATAVRGPPLTRGGRVMVADPTRRRLLLLDDDNGWSVRAYSPAKHETGVARNLPFDARSLVVVSGAIWVSGISAGGKPVLARLDPATLRVVGRGELAPTPGAAPTLVAGQSVLWLRRGSRLWCMDARNGAIAQKWRSLPGTVASRNGRAFVAHGADLWQLRLNGGCAG